LKNRVELVNPLSLTNVMTRNVKVKILNH